LISVSVSPLARSTVALVMVAPYLRAPGRASLKASS
jgi:hypothetical protein